MDRQEKQRLDEHIEGVYADTEDTNYLEAAQTYWGYSQAADSATWVECHLRAAQVAATIATAQATERQAVALEQIVGQFVADHTSEAIEADCAVGEMHKDLAGEDGQADSFESNSGRMTVDTLEGQVATLRGALGRLDILLYKAGYRKEGAYRIIIGDALDAVGYWNTKPTPSLTHDGDVGKMYRDLAGEEPTSTYKKEVKPTFRDSSYTFRISTEQDNQEGIWHFVAWEHDDVEDLCPTGHGETVYAAIANLCCNLDKEDNDEDGRP